jgi:DNA (cytosine-5)-methyltransferase 1
VKKLRVLELFAGIGGFSLGLERAGGFETVAFCEIEPYCRAVLAKHWPGVKQYDDVRTLTADTLRSDGIAVDVICGGFPCQDISFAGKRAGLEGARSGLWREYARLIGELRPRFVIVENVPGLLNLGMGAVLGDLSALGYGATWDCIPASAVGAPHRRDRVWIVAYARSEQHKSGCASIGRETAKEFSYSTDAASKRCAEAGQFRYGKRQERVASICEDVADAGSSRLQNDKGRGTGPKRNGDGAFDGGCGLSGRDHDWSFEPDVGRVAHGVPARVDRLKALGNSVVPQIPELIGKAIMQAEGITP